MAPEAIAAALASAVIHASWNAVLKTGRDRLIDVGVMGIGGVLFGIVLCAWRGAPAPASWPFLAGSAVVHVAYWIGLGRSYASGDMSHVYTIARGLAPLLVTAGALLAAHEAPSAPAAAGIVLVSLGIGALGFSPHAPVRATGWAIATGITIATYSLLDALGVRSSGDPLAYIGVSAIAGYVPMSTLCLLRRRPTQIVLGVRGRWGRLLLAGVLSEVAFGLALWAQTIAPIAYVTALRETSVVFGAAIATWVLREPVRARRWLGAGVVASGAALLVLGH